MNKKKKKKREDDREKKNNNKKNKKKKKKKKKDSGFAISLRSRIALLFANSDRLFAITDRIVG